MHKKYDVIYSIGNNCGCAMYLNMLGLRIASGPFDWVTGANSLEERINIILNDFNRFIDKDDLICLNRGVHNNISYSNKYNDLIFMHDFDKNCLFDDMYPKVKEKYDRRIQRFIDNIKSKKVLLI